jgi:hypothetical protein
VCKSAAIPVPLLVGSVVVVLVAVMMTQRNPRAFAQVNLPSRTPSAEITAQPRATFVPIQLEGSNGRRFIVTRLTPSPYFGYIFSRTNTFLLPEELCVWLAMVNLVDPNATPDEIIDYYAHLPIEEDVIRVVGRDGSVYIPLAYSEYPLLSNILPSVNHLGTPIPRNLYPNMTYCFDTSELSPGVYTTIVSMLSMSDERIIHTWRFEIRDDASSP